MLYQDLGPWFLQNHPKNLGHLGPPKSGGWRSPTFHPSFLDEILLGSLRFLMAKTPPRTESWASRALGFKTLRYLSMSGSELKRDHICTETGLVHWTTRVTFGDKGGNICGKTVKKGNKRIQNLQCASRDQLDKGSHPMALPRHMSAWTQVIKRR